MREREREREKAVRLEAALRRMLTVCHQSTARAIRMHRIRLLSYRSRGTLMSYSDHSAQRCFKSNAPSFSILCLDQGALG